VGGGGRHTQRQEVSAAAAAAAGKQETNFISVSQADNITTALHFPGCNCSAS